MRKRRNDPAFAKELAALADIYVNDAFSCAHRAHASTEGIAHLLPAVAGRLMQAELDHLSAALGNPQRPVMAIVGGAKVSTKLDLLGNLVGKVDLLVIGGGMANTFLFAEGKEVGKSLAERDMAETARKIVTQARQKNCRIVLPVDAVTAAEFKAGVPDQDGRYRRGAGGSDDPRYRAEIGQGDRRTLEDLQDPGLEWAGGRFRNAAFRPGHHRGSQGGCRPDRGEGPALGRGRRRYGRGLGPCRGGRPVLLCLDRGGAFLEWLEGKDLPGVAALKRR